MDANLTGSSIAESYPVLVDRCRQTLADALHEVAGPDASIDELGMLDLDYADRRAFAEAVAKGALSRVELYTFRDLAPALARLADEPLPVGEIKTRLGNRLRQVGVDRWGLLLDEKVARVLAWPNAGVGSASELLGHALVAAAEGPKTSTRSAGTTPADAASGASDEVAQLLAAAREIAAYGASIDPSTGWLDAVIEMRTRGDLPPLVASAIESLALLPCQSLAGAAATEYDLDALVARVLGRLNDKQLEVFIRRVLTPTAAPTLDDLGREQGVTRERIRQIEAKAKDKIERSLAEPAQALLVAAAEQLGQELGVAVPVADLPARLAPLTTTTDPSDGGPSQTARFLAWLAGGYRVSGGWLLRRDSGDLAGRAMSQLRAESREGIVPADAAVAALGRLGFREAPARAWIEAEPRLRLIDEDLLIWEGGLPDKAAIVLRLRGTTMTLDELFEAIAEERSVQSLVNALSANARFRRRGKSRWGLAEWGGDEYTSTVDLMLDEIEVCGGEASVDHLIESITSKFPDVLPATVSTYASSVHFVRTAAKTIRARRPTDPYITDGRVELARDCYLIEGHWALRVLVNADHLRGSGFLIPTPFAVRLGVRPSERIEFSSEWGPISIGWRTQTQMSSIRTVITALGAEEGDLVFLRFLPPARVEAFRVRRRDIESATPEEQVLLQVGADQFTSDPLVAVGRALGLASPEHASVAELEARLREKGDEHLLSLLPTRNNTTIAASVLMTQLEGQRLEKKETLSLDTREGGRDKGVELSAVKSVVGFLNAEGGVLFIGVSDDSRATGVEPDLELLGVDLDRYELHLRNLLTKAIGDATVAKSVAIRFHPINGKTVAEVRVDPSPHPIYMPDKNGALTLFVRIGNQTKALALDEAVKYISQHFGGDLFAREILESSAQPEDSTEGPTDDQAEEAPEEPTGEAVDDDSTDTEES